MDWTKVTVDLSAYDHKEIYVALQYISPTIEGVVMMVDDIQVKSGAEVLTVQKKRRTCCCLLPRDVKHHFRLTDYRSKVLQYFRAALYDSGTIGTDYYRIPLTAYPTGVYMARVQTDKGTKTLKFVVK